MQVVDEPEATALINEINQIPHLVMGRVREFHRTIDYICANAINACHELLIIALDVCFYRLQQLHGEIASADKLSEAVEHINCNYVPA
jgi:hypothetical protein